VDFVISVLKIGKRQFSPFKVKPCGPFFYGVNPIFMYQSCFLLKNKSVYRVETLTKYYKYITLFLGLKKLDKGEGRAK